MRRRKRHDDKAAAARSSTTSPRGFDHRPFRQLAGTRRDRRPAAPAPAVAPQPAEPDESDLFRREMADVRPLPDVARARVAPSPPAPAQRVVSDPDAEALAELSDLVA